MTTGTPKTGEKKRGQRGRFTRTPDTIERDAEVVRLRAQQHTFAAIANRLGFANAGGAQRAYERGIAAIIRPPAEEAVKLEVAKLNEIERGAWEMFRKEHPLVSHGRLITDDDGNPLPDITKNLAAADRLFKAAERRAKLLGLDTPVKVDATVHQVDARDAELLEMVNEARAQRAIEDGGR